MNDFNLNHPGACDQVMALHGLVTDLVMAAVHHPAPEWLTDDLWTRLLAAANLTADPRGNELANQEGLDL